MTRTQIIQLVQKDTENKLNDQIDFQAKLTQVMQEFCAEHRFWWRKKYLTFSTVANTAKYDLTAITTTPTGAGAFVEEITKVQGIDSSNNVFDLNPVTDDASITKYIIDSTADQPGVWMPDPSDLSNMQIIRLGKVPNGVYTIYVYFWAMPNPDQDTSDDVIYIVPKFHHHILQTGLEREVWRLVYGEQDPKFTTASALYQKKVAQAKIKRSIDAGHTPRFRNEDDEAIRSSGSHWWND